MDDPRVARKDLRTGWASWLARLSMALLLFEALSGLAITLLPFHATVQWSVIIHTLLGLVLLLPLAWYCAAHLSDYRGYALSHITLLGYVGVIALFGCLISGLVVTGEGLFAIWTSELWRQIHLLTTLLAVGTLLPHVVFSLLRSRRDGPAPAAMNYIRTSFGVGVGLRADARMRPRVSRRAIPESLSGGLQLSLRDQSAVCTEFSPDGHRRRL